MTPRNYPPQLRWMFVPDVGHLLVLADNYDPVQRTVRALDLSLVRTVRGVPVPVGRVPAAALVRPRGYPATLLGEWTKQAWARWRIEKDEREARAVKDGPCSWNSKDRASAIAKLGSNALKPRRRKSRPDNRFLKHKRR